MRVAVVIPSLEAGGAEWVASRWVGGLRDRGHSVVVITYVPSRAEGSGMDGHIPFPGASTISRWVAFPWWLRRTLRTHRIDVALSLITFSNLALLAGTWRMRCAPAVVVSERNVPSLYRFEGRFTGGLQHRLGRVLYRRAAAVVAISHPVATDLRVRYGVQPSRLFVVPNPATDQKQSRTELVSPGVRLVFVGRLVSQKQPGRFLDTVTALRARGLNVEATIVGEGSLRCALEQRVSAEGLACTFLGWQRNWMDDSKSWDCLVLPSDLEGFGNVLVEAAAVGLPVVALSESLGVADAIVPGVTGVLALSPAAGDLADAVVMATGLRGVEDATGWLAWYGLENSLDRLEAVLERVRQ